MKANKFFFCVVASFLTAQTLSPDLLINILQTNNRKPASELETTKKADETKTEDATCNSELKGDKLKEEVNDLIEDKEEVLKRIVKKEDKKSKKQKKQSENSELIALMSQFTTMLSTQMQKQMEMQIQMMNMFSQMQTALPSVNPYSPTLFPLSPPPQGFVSLSDSLGFLNSTIGVQAHASPWSDYSNPFSITANMNSNSEQTDFDYSINQNPSHLPFYQSPPTLDKRQMVQPLPQMQRQEMPINDLVIAV